MPGQVKDIVATKTDIFEKAYTISSNYSLIGKSLRAQVKDKPDGKTLLTFDLTDSTILVVGQTVTLTHNADVMKALKVGIYVWDLIAFTDETDEKQLIRGKFEVTYKVTVQAA